MNEIVKRQTTWTTISDLSVGKSAEEYALAVRKEIVLQEGELTLLDNLNAPTIYEVKKTMSRRDMLLIVRETILKTAKTMKFAEKMDESLANQLASDLLETLRHESIDDIILMFKMARQGKCGHTDGRIDADTINFIIVPAYLEHKAALREKQYKKEKYANRSIEQKGMSEEAFQKFSELSQKLTVKKTEDKPKKPAVNHHQIYLSKLKERLPTYSLELLKETEEKMIGKDVYADALKLVRTEIANR